MKEKWVVSFNRRAGEKGRKKDATCVQPPKPWIMPKRRSIKLNVDGSFCDTDGTGGICMVLRDETSMIVVSACSFLSSCSGPLQAKLESCRESIAMAMEWSTLQCLIKMDCTEVVKMIKAPGINQSLSMGIVQEIKEHLIE
jgi:ribonuclease HI